MTCWSLMNVGVHICVQDVVTDHYNTWFVQSSEGYDGIYRLPVDGFSDRRTSKEVRSILISVVGNISTLTRKLKASWEPFLIVRRKEARGEPDLPRFSEKFIGRYR